MKKGLNIAVVGATGAVGKAMLSILASRKFPIQRLVCFASERSLGKELNCGDLISRCEVMRPGCFAGIDIAFFDASDAISKEWVPQAAQAGAWVIDNSATFRMDPQTALIVPEVNPERLEEVMVLGARPGSHWTSRVLSGPNCSTVQLVVILRRIALKWGLKRVVVSSYQSTSGAGAAAMDELTTQIQSVLESKPVRPVAFVHQIAFNCIPQIGGFKDDGYTSEEHKIIQESRKLLDLPDLKITATAVRVPTYSSHAETVNIETLMPFQVSEVRQELASGPGIIVIDEPSMSCYPLGVSHPGSRVEASTGRDAVYVGRIRRDESLENGLNLWVVSDNLRKGAALNAIQIGEILAKKVFSKNF